MSFMFLGNIKFFKNKTLCVSVFLVGFCFCLSPVLGSEHSHTSGREAVEASGSSVGSSHESGREAMDSSTGAASALVLRVPSPVPDVPQPPPMAPWTDLQNTIMENTAQIDFHAQAALIVALERMGVYENTVVEEQHLVKLRDGEAFRPGERKYKFAYNILSEIFQILFRSVITDVTTAILLATRIISKQDQDKFFQETISVCYEQALTQARGLLTLFADRHAQFMYDVLERENIWAARAEHAGFSPDGIPVGMQQARVGSRSRGMILGVRVQGQGDEAREYEVTEDTLKTRLSEPELGGIFAYRVETIVRMAHVAYNHIVLISTHPEMSLEEARRQVDLPALSWEAFLAKVYYHLLKQKIGGDLIRQINESALNYFGNFILWTYQNNYKYHDFSLADILIMFYSSLSFIYSRTGGIPVIRPYSPEELEAIRRRPPATPVDPSSIDKTPQRPVAELVGEMDERIARDFKKRQAMREFVARSEASKLRKPVKTLVPQSGLSSSSGRASSSVMSDEEQLRVLHNVLMIAVRNAQRVIGLVVHMNEHPGTVGLDM
jgi:hypothetical protein